MGSGLLYLPEVLGPPRLLECPPLEVGIPGKTLLRLQRLVVDRGTGLRTAQSLRSAMRAAHLSKVAWSSMTRFRGSRRAAGIRMRLQPSPMPLICRRLRGRPRVLQFAHQSSGFALLFGGARRPRLPQLLNRIIPLPSETFLPNDCRRRQSRPVLCNWSW